MRLRDVGQLTCLIRDFGSSVSESPLERKQQQSGRLMEFFVAAELIATRPKNKVWITSTAREVYKQNKFAALD
jgi:hypothetical protein